MLKTHSQLNKETYIGLGLFVGVLLFFFINAFYIAISLIDVYGAKKVNGTPSTINDTVLSQAVKALNLDSSEE